MFLKKELSDFMILIFDKISGLMEFGVQVGFEFLI